MALAAAGVAVPQVVDVPRVAIITTGAELAASATACIHDANGPFLPSAVALAGGRALAPAPVGDDVTAIATAITAAASQAEVVITTGGVSTGALDLVPAALARLGATILFHRVAIRPGKPVLLARLPQAGPLVLGLPGNPVAVAVGWRFFGVPLLRRLLGQAPEEWLPARVSADLRRRPDLTFFAKAYAWVDQEALLRVAVLPGQESFKVRPLVRANCWAIAEADAATLQAGAILPVLPAVPGAFPGAAGPQ
jgi:molybdopterin molybdotransferase